MWLFIIRKVLMFRKNCWWVTIPPGSAEAGSQQTWDIGKTFVFQGLQPHVPVTFRLFFKASFQYYLPLLKPPRRRSAVSVIHNGVWMFVTFLLFTKTVSVIWLSSNSTTRFLILFFFHHVNNVKTIFSNERVIGIVCDVGSMWGTLLTHASQ